MNKKEFRNFEDAREFIHSLKITSRSDWEKLKKSEKIPWNIPNSPDYVYKNDGWKGWGDFLGTGTIATFDLEFLSYDDAKKSIHKLKIPSKNAFFRLGESNKLPNGIPKDPADSYKKKGTWKGWGDFLGTGTIAFQLRKYSIMEDAKKEARQLAIKFNLRTHEDWVKAHREGKIPKHLPANPWHVYAKNKRKKK